MGNQLAQILVNLSNKISEYSAISGEELMLLIDQEMEKLTEEDKTSLAEMVDGNTKTKIFESITGKHRISVFSPDMHVQINHLGEIFFCPPTHRYMPNELDKAFVRLVNIRFSDVAQQMDDFVCSFMKKCHYQISDSKCIIQKAFKSYQAANDNFEYFVYLFPSITFVSQCIETIKSMDKDLIIVVPSEKSPAPFVEFIRENSELTEKDTKIMIWVANISQKNISPFVGLCKDEEFWINFSNPEKSLQAAKMWCKGVIKSKVLDNKI